VRHPLEAPLVLVVEGRSVLLVREAVRDDNVGSGVGRGTNVAEEVDDQPDGGSQSRSPALPIMSERRPEGRLAPRDGVVRGCGGHRSARE